MEKIINKIAEQLYKLEDNDGEVVINDEFDIDENSIAAVDGSIYYTTEYDNGDHDTAPYSERKFEYADLKVTIFTNENVKILTNEELEKLYEIL